MDILERFFPGFLMDVSWDQVIYEAYALDA